MGSLFNAAARVNIDRSSCFREDSRRQRIQRGYCLTEVEGLWVLSASFEKSYTASGCVRAVSRLLPL